METKKWKEYDKEEKESLLLHWWYYYGKLLITWDEIKKFNTLISEKPDKVFDLAVVSYIYGLSSQPLINAMRNDKVEELLETLPKKDNLDKDVIEKLEEVEDDFTKMIVSSINEPEPPVPMDQQEVVEQAARIIKKNNKK